MPDQQLVENLFRTFSEILLNLNLKLFFIFIFPIYLPQEPSSSSFFEQCGNLSHSKSLSIQMLLSSQLYLSLRHFLLDPLKYLKIFISHDIHAFIVTCLPL